MLTQYIHFLSTLLADQYVKDKNRTSQDLQEPIKALFLRFLKHPSEHRHSSSFSLQGFLFQGPKKERDCFTNLSLYG